MPSDMQSLLSTFDPISLEETNQEARLLTRTDSKYMVPWDTFVDWARTLHASHRILEIDNRRLFTYDTRYFDTSDLDLFRHHIQGRRRRFKIRTRQYVESKLSFLEIKLRGRRGETIKQRIPHDPDHIDEIGKEGHNFLDACIRAQYNFDLNHTLVPTMQTLYRRATFVARDGTDRITCDVDLNFVRCGESQALMRPSMVLVEIKSTKGRGPFDRALWHRGVRPAQGSKYCIGICLALTRERSNRYLREIRTYFRKVDDHMESHRSFPNVSFLGERPSDIKAGQLR
ncbi:MAG TPA: polyphosphate polymerase domain-containing protein [Thermomicrobiales bacterium]|nr:polyphosphate polymerase domain-containing protein [Thermomicrobiales bacterium]